MNAASLSPPQTLIYPLCYFGCEYIKRGPGLEMNNALYYYFTL